MAHLLPVLERSFLSQPWLVLADLRLPGMFVFELQRHPATILSSTASLEQFQAALLALSEKRAPSPSEVLRNSFENGVRAMVETLPARWPEVRELRCGCAVSLGLGNRQMVPVLHLGYGTVKLYIHQLLDELTLPTREDLAAYVAQALAPLCSLAADPLYRTGRNGRCSER